MKTTAIHHDSIMKKPQKSIKKSSHNNEIYYATPAKPLDFSFKEIRNLEDLIKIEPRSGIRKSLEEIIKSKDNQEKNQDNLKLNSLDEDFQESKFDKKNRKESLNEVNDVIEAKINNDLKSDIKGNKINKSDDLKLQGTKKKIKYIIYTNTIILQSNQTKSFEKIDSAFNDILPDINYFAMQNRSKLDLIQWVDISFNKIQDIHPDLLNLKFLKILYCHANHIIEIEKILVLGHSKSLLNLTLHGNPIEQIKGYRQYIIEIVPSLEKLDFTLVSEKELDIIFHRGSRWGEKRNKNGTFEANKFDRDSLTIN